MMPCWIYRRVVSGWLEPGATPPAWLSRHLQTCPRCQRRWGAERALVRRLQAEACNLPRSAPPALAVRVDARRRALAEGRGSEDVLPLPGWPAVKWAAAVVGVALLGVMAWSLHRSEPARQVAAVDPAPLSASVDWVEADRLLALSQPLDRPLEQEWERMASDARTVVGALAASFLPETP